uniref:Uncharacterized protein n=1 Tax=Rhizophora mucronata TaxID=61149 RepID=A0A2P2N185_RHIMU
MPCIRDTKGSTQTNLCSAYKRLLLHDKLSHAD